MLPNIQTDLLRTLVTVVEMRSFTKAANLLGVTQPAVSAQIKRLQIMLGYELLDKGAPGVSLTARGEKVVDYARRMLAINDEILRLTDGDMGGRTIRVGIPSDYSGVRIPGILVKFRLGWPDVGFIVSSGTTESLLSDLNRGNFDLVMSVTESEPAYAPRHRWMRKAVWVHSDATSIDPNGPVPLVSYAEDCACQRLAVGALRDAGRDCNLVFTGFNVISLAAAIKAGLGVMVMPSGRAIHANLSIWEDPPLPALSPLHVGIHVRDGGDRAAIEELADHLASNLRTENWHTLHPAPVFSNLLGEVRH
ncbi:MAG: LysR family transcriptional regulator [Xanthobacteraceae bacterium]